MAAASQNDRAPTTSSAAAPAVLGPPRSPDLDSNDAREGGDDTRSPQQLVQDNHLEHRWHEEETQRRNRETLELSIEDDALAETTKGEEPRQHRNLELGKETINETSEGRDTAISELGNAGGPPRTDDRSTKKEDGRDTKKGRDNKTVCSDAGNANGGDDEGADGGADKDTDGGADKETDSGTDEDTDDGADEDTVLLKPPDPWPEVPQSVALSRFSESTVVPHSGVIADLSDEELEGAFTRLELCVRMDRLTLGERLEALRRQRDTALAAYLSELSRLTSCLTRVEGSSRTAAATAVAALQQHVRVVGGTVDTLVGAAQEWGAVQSEWQFSRTVELLQAYTRLTMQRHQQALLQIRQLSSLVTPPAVAPRPARGDAPSGGGKPLATLRRRNSVIASPSTHSGRRGSLCPEMLRKFAPDPTFSRGILPALNLDKVNKIEEEEDESFSPENLTKKWSSESSRAQAAGGVGKPDNPQPPSPPPPRARRRTEEHEEEEEEEEEEDTPESAAGRLRQCCHHVRMRVRRVMQTTFNKLRSSSLFPQYPSLISVRCVLICILLLGAFALLVTAVISCPHPAEQLGSGGPCSRRSWTSLFESCHPFVQVNHVGGAHTSV